MELAAGLAPLLEDPNVGVLRARPELRVLVSGWSASGKSVLARHLAALLECEYLCASNVLTTELGMESVDWIDERTRVEALRSTEHERTLDDRLLHHLSESPRIVLDSWVAPFRSTVHDVAVWIECDLDSRIQNAIGPDGKRNYAATRRVRDGLVAKDDDSVRRFKSAYGFVFGPDPNVFQVMVDISDDISAEISSWPNERLVVARKIVKALANQLAG
ncbi:cytidylate kinase [Nocardioides salarius]|uniref:Cytidylate kinase n=1 Tax=Nocardioides salarius TaxID=374513 RepID=A0ABS2MGA2_9ACTN|nr:hypothetical protein [Nocardioides salarius]MBM7510222.1 cytidylate kinase [Nocardioides salarius]